MVKPKTFWEVDLAKSSRTVKGVEGKGRKGLSA